MNHSQRYHASRSDEGRYRILIEAIADYAIFMLDPEGNVSSWNPGAERIKGYSEEEILGRHFSVFYTEEELERDEPRQALETAAREGRFAREGWRLRKDGTRFWANVVIDPIRDDDGTLVEFAKITRDFTEREAAQRELEKAREALFQSQKMEAIGQLTGGVAHDFNNLLMAILSSLALLRKRLGVDDVQAIRLLDNAILGAERGAALTQRMLAFARRQDLQVETIDIPARVRGMTELIQRSLGPSVMIDTRFPLNLPSVKADASQLEMAVLNLVVNARDAMPSGGTITISAREHRLGTENPPALPAGRYVCLSVSDTGVGMDADTLARATEPFFTTKGVGKGTGLGLPMILGMAAQSGGRFLLHSNPEEGTVAELWLPVADAQSEPELQASPLHAPPQSRRLRILAVDDDSLVLINTVALLEDLGHQVVEASSAAEALAAAGTVEELDLVITDQAMPQMTGLELATAIHAQRPEMPIIIATGYGELPPHFENGIRKLAKPFRQNQLVDAIEEILGAD